VIRAYRRFHGPPPNPDRRQTDADRIVARDGRAVEEPARRRGGLVKASGLFRGGGRARPHEVPPIANRLAAEGLPVTPRLDVGLFTWRGAFDTPDAYRAFIDQNSDAMIEGAKAGMFPLPVSS
jgi:hypothetical protein